MEEFQIAESDLHFDAPSRSLINACGMYKHLVEQRIKR